MTPPPVDSPAHHAPPVEPAPHVRASAELPRWHSTELLAHGGEARILHGDQVYRLRLTALGKLILTK
ncbi:hemin uptake protein HemP [Vitreoscilla filiformis]|uniref:hemin uptake protein HemP n=1 Tax=Vitreoscilla filiformis TaxID=63 RepID=UPI000B7A9A57|nr:hemin uptake protein HemP [Vitreoscilla filiformis]